MELIEQSVRKISTSAAFPVPLEDIKLDLRVDSDDEDEMVQRCARGAAAFLEKRTGWALIPGTYQATLGEWFCDPLEIWKAPFRELESVEYLSAADTWTDVDLSNFRTSQREKSFLVIPAAAFTRPAVFQCVDSIRLTFTAGFDVEDSSFGNGDFPIDDGIKTLLIMLIAHWYKNRELFLADKEAEIIERAGSLLGAYRTYY
jgi:uncharacterized phiE125 gp8 family phage protein